MYEECYRWIESLGHRRVIKKRLTRTGDVKVVCYV
jgi:hypothetical protein